MATKNDTTTTKTTNQDPQAGRPAAGAPAGTVPASPVQAAAPDAQSPLAALTAEHEALKARAAGFREELLRAKAEVQALQAKLDAIRVGVPKFSKLTEAGSKPTEALTEIEEAVEEGQVYLREMKKLHAGAEKSLTKAETGPYRVTETKHNVNVQGGLTTIPVGTIVSAASYGLRGVQSLREQGVKMELVEERAA